jgi:hypothetical protein
LIFCLTVLSEPIIDEMQPVQPPTDKLDQVLTPRELDMAKQRINSSMIGSESTVKQKIKAFHNNQ